MLAVASFLNSFCNCVSLAVLFLNKFKLELGAGSGAQEAEAGGRCLPAPGLPGHRTEIWIFRRISGSGDRARTDIGIFVRSGNPESEPGERTGTIALVGSSKVRGNSAGRVQNRDVQIRPRSRQLQSECWEQDRSAAKEIGPKYWAAVAWQSAARRLWQLSLKAYLLFWNGSNSFWQLF